MVSTIAVSCPYAQTNAATRNEAHKAAFLAGYIHRDISVGNILIFTTKVKGKTVRKGLLCDWELSKRLDDHGKGPRQPDRTVRCLIVK